MYLQRYIYIYMNILTNTYTMELKPNHYGILHTLHNIYLVSFSPRRSNGTRSIEETDISTVHGLNGVITPNSPAQRILHGMLDRIRSTRLRIDFKGNPYTTSLFWFN